jgi:type II secretory pathway predicted ATPase ExeA
MYLEHFGLTEAPFRITPHTEFFFAGANRGATLEALLYAITHDEGIVKVSGEVGSGKTMLCRVLMERLPAHVVIVYLANPSLSRDDILFALADELELGIPDGTRPSAVVRSLQTRLIELYGQGRQVVVLIDEAHAMPKETLEEIRLLSNLESSQHKLLQLVMFGQPELDEVLVRPDMRQLKERITQNFRLEPLRRDDVAEYLDFRMRTAGYRGPDVFSPAAVKLIARASQGLTRRINILADKSLLAAYAGNGHQITPEQVSAAIRDSEYGDGGQRRRRIVLAVGGAAAVALLAVALVTTTHKEDSAPGPAVPTSASVQTATAVAAPIRPGQPVPSNSPAAAPAPEAAVQANLSPAAAAVPRPGPGALADRFAETRQWIAATPGQRWFVQLVVIDGRETDYARGFFARASRLLPDEAVRIYLADVGDERRIGVISGDYSSRQAAMDAKPYARQVRALK